MSIRRLLSLALCVFLSSAACGETYQQGYDEGFSTGFDDGFNEGSRRGVSEGALAGQEDGFDAGWDEGYWPAYNSAYEIGEAAGFRSGWIDSYADAFDTKAKSLEFIRWTRSQSSAGSSISISLLGSGTINGLDFISWSDSKFTTVTSPYDDGYSLGYDAGFADGDSTGYEAEYQPAYDLAYPIGFEDGEVAGAQQGPIDGQEDGYEFGADQGEDAGKLVAADDAVLFFQDGGTLSRWFINRDELAAAAFALHNPDVLVQEVPVATLTEATNLMQTTVGLGAVSVVPEPSTTMLACMGILWIARRKFGPSN